MKGATWVETGTYRGDTTEYLARLSGNVISIEPDGDLFRAAAKRFVNDSRIKLVQGSSEDVFEHVVNSLTGRVCFWLDGHFSGPGTYEGPASTPISWEFQCIAMRLPKFSAAAILIDDFREFPPVHGTSWIGGYPYREELVQWAQINGLTWTVEHDIFIMETGA